MAKQFYTNGTGAQQTLTPSQNEKVAVYDTVADAEADLANLEEGQLVATPDTGDELAQPVNTVEADNMHAVTSNAVAESFKVVSDNGWTIFKIGTKYIGFIARSEGASTPINNSYGNMFISASKSLALPQNVKNIQSIAGSAGKTSGGVLYVSVNDTRSAINIKTPVGFYYASPVSYTASEAGAVFYCFGEYE